jgi:hypothetical protein
MRTTGRRGGALAIATAALLAAALTACGGSTGGSGSADDSDHGPIIGGSLHPTPSGGWSSAPRSTEPDEPDHLPETPDVPATPDQPESSQDGGGNTVSGHAYRADGSPMSDVMIYFRVVPESYGALYRTSTDGDGAYSYDLPDGVYIVLASTPGDPDVSVELTPRQTGPDGVAGVSVPPAHVVDFDEA